MSRRTSQRKKFRISRKLIITILIVLVVAIMALDSMQRSKRSLSPQLASDRVLGNPDSPLRITEFIDFQCHECAKAFFLLHELIEKYPSQIYIEVKYFPLGQPHSLDSAIYAECAARQGKFWEYIELLFKRQSQWRSLTDANPMYQAMAQEAGLDLLKMNSCVRSNEASSAVLADKVHGEASFVKMTPTFFINKKMFVGYKSISEKLKNYFNDDHSE